MIVIDNARVLRASGVETAAVTIDGDRVVAVGPPPEANGADVIDAGGAWLGPGLVDLHVHFRDPGQTWKEDLFSGARAASAGGFTAVVTMPNTDPAIDNGPKASAALARAAAVDDVLVVIAGALTRGREGAEMADLAAMYEAGIRIFTDDGDCVPDAVLLRRIMAGLGDLPGALVAEHPEDRSLTGDGHIHEGPTSVLHGVGGLPGVAEDVIVARDLALALATGARLHLQHVSTATAVDLIRNARAMGVDVTAEVTPHHLALEDDSLVDLDPNLKMYPPLRPAIDREAVILGLREGVIDAVATDHAPHTIAEKAVPFEEAPRGVIGLETAASVVSVALNGDQMTFFDRMSTAPARIAGLERHGGVVEPGAPANLVLFDPGRSWVPDGFASKSANSPFTGRELVGKVMATIYEGRVVYGGDMS
jgi:dihydroorotase